VGRLKVGNSGGIMITTHLNKIKMTSAIIDGDNTTVEKMINCGYVFSEREEAAIVLAAARGDKEMICTLLPQRKWERLDEALLSAIIGGHLEVANIVAEKCTDPDAILNNSINETLFECAERGSNNSMRVLIKKGGNVNYKDGSIMAAAAKYNRVTTMAMLEEEYGVMADKKALYEAARSGSKEAIEHMIKMGIDLTTDNCKAIKIAGTNNQWECVQLMLKAGIHPFKQVIMEIDPQEQARILDSMKTEVKHKKPAPM